MEEGRGAKRAEDKRDAKEPADHAPETVGGLSARADDKLSSPSKSPMMMITNSPHSPVPDRKSTSADASVEQSSSSGSSSSASTGPEPLRPLGTVRLGALGGSSQQPQSHQALPHHIPKTDALSRRMEDIRKTMGDEVSNLCCCFFNQMLSLLCLLQGLRAPWDSKGRPLGAIGGGEGGSNLSRK